MAHSHQEHERQYHRRGCIICELIHRLSILEGDVETMSQAWEEQESRFARDVSELKSKFDTLNTKVNELTTQVDSAEATEAAEYAADFKAQLDQFESAFGLGGTETPPAESGGGAPTDPPVDGGGSTETPVEPPAGGGDVVPEPPAGGEGSVTDPTQPPVDSSGSGEGGSPSGGEATPDPGVGGEPLPGESDQAPHPDNTLPGDLGGGSGGETPPEAGTPEAPVTDDPNAGNPSASTDSPGSDPTIPVPGAEPQQ